MTINVDPETFLLRKRIAAAETASAARAKLRRLGGGDDEAAVLERDAAAIHRILSCWRRIGKREASPIMLPSARRLTPKSCATGTARGGLERRPRRKGRR
jgi:hypothetical protein